MQETIILKNGKEINFYSSLSSNGIFVEVSEMIFADKEEKKLFEKELKSERDVVKITYVKV